MTTEIAVTTNSESLAGRKSVEGEQLPQLDTGLLGQAILELNISRKNFSTYPLGHSQITTSVDKAFGLLDRLMNQRHELILGFTKNHIFAERKQLDFRNPVYREFSHALHSLDIATVSFAKDLTKEEVFHFVKIIAQTIEESDGQSNIALAMDEANIRHITIEKIDYNRFHLTEETEIFPSESTDSLQPSDIWRAFVQNLLSEDALERTYRDQLTRMHSSEFACFLNEGKIDPAIALQNYQKTLKEMFLLEIRRQPDMKLESLLKNLQPELRQQFLSVTFDYASRGSTGFLENYTNEMILEMLLQANAQHKQLSPSLITLLEKLSLAEGAMPMNSEMFGMVDSAVDSGVVKENLRKLLEHESYDDYVDGGYRAMLRRLSVLHSEPEPKSSPKMDQPQDASDVLSLAESWAEVFDEKYLEQHLGHMCLALMDQDLEFDVYKGFAEKMVSETANLIDIGAYEIVLMMIQSFRRHSQEKTSTIRIFAEESLLTLTASETVVKVLNMAQVGSSDQVGMAYQILSAIGKSTIPGIMERYIEDESPRGNRALFELLKHLGKDSLEEAHLRLGDSRIPVLRKMLAFIREIDSDESIPHIRPLITHGDPLIRLDALSALLQFKDSNAADYLCQLLRSNDLKECFGAIQLSGSFRVREVTGDLSNLLIKSPWRKLDYRKNTAIIKSLGKIGDPGVLPALLKLSRKTFSVYPDKLRKMKIAFYESLHGYPKESISQIIQYGIKANDYRIRTICKNLS